MKTFLPSSKALLLVVVLFLAMAKAEAQNSNVVNPDKTSISLLDFSVAYENVHARIKWTAKIEKSFSHFVIEQSVDGKEYQDHAVFFGAENPAGAEHFSFKDAHLNASSGIIYYRLKMVDVSGKISYSQVQIVRTKKDNSRVS